MFKRLLQHLEFILDTDESMLILATGMLSGAGITLLILALTGTLK